MDCKTAYYVFDLRRAAERAAYLHGLLGENVSLAYAVKANPFLTGGLEKHVERLEICSPGEAAICERFGVPDGKMVISGVYKTPEFIENSVAGHDGRIYTVESLRQFDLLRALSEKYGKRLPVLLRLTNDSQFGINESEIRDLISRRAEFPGLHILGVQFFSGTQKTSLRKLTREIAHLDALLQELETDFGYRAEELEYGTGFPVNYYAGESLDEEALITGFRQVLEGMAFRAKITLELGRSMAACCGSYYTHVVDKKCNKGQNYLLVDGGMHQIVYFGQYMGMKHPMLTLCGKETAPLADSWNICGSLCSMNDILAKSVPLPEVAVGDTLCFHNAGAYCMTEGIALFLSRELPAVYLIGEDGTETLARFPVETAQFNSPVS